jgi:hypothetical protein
MDSGVAPLLLSAIMTSTDSSSASSSCRRSSSSAPSSSRGEGAIGASLAVRIDILAASRGWLSFGPKEVKSCKSLFSMKIRILEKQGLLGQKTRVNSS